ncbi:MAG: hypothetical protein AAF990_17210 [Bacteroidota bacterium]
MKLFYIICTLFCCLLWAAPTKAQKHQFGVSLDIMLTNVNGKKVLSEDSEIDFNNYESTYFTIGTYYRLAPYRSRLSWQAALRYGNIWYGGRIDYPDDLIYENFYPSMQLHILHIPLNVQVDMGHEVKALFGLAVHQIFVKSESQRDFVFPGNSLRDELTVEAQRSFDKAVNETQIFWEAGLKLGFGRIEIQVKYQSLLTDFFNKIELRGEGHQVDVSYRTYQMGMSYRLFGSY